MRLRAPSHATVVAYLALFVAIGGSAYAVTKIGSAQIDNRSIKGKDVADDALGGRQVNEAKLTGPLAVGNATSLSCDPSAGSEVPCVTVHVRLHVPASLLMFATARSGGGGSGSCAPTVDGDVANSQIVEDAQSAIAVTRLTPTLNRGDHTVALSCREAGGNLVVDDLAISAVAVDNADLGP